MPISTERIAATIGVSSGSGIPVGLVGLLHPTGAPGFVTRVGSAVSPLPHHAEAGASSPLTLLVPSREECRERGWLPGAVSRTVESLDTDAVLYAAVPAAWRLRLRRMLRARGLIIVGTVLHVRGRSGADHLVSLSPAPLRYAAAGRVPLTRIVATAVRGASFVPAALWLAEHSLPRIGLIAMRPTSRPLLEWAGRLAGSAPPAGMLAIGSWRGDDGSIMHLFGTDGAPTAVAKIGPAGDASTETAGLEEIAPGAGAAGLRVPRLLGRDSLGGRPVAMVTPVAGVPASRWLAGREARMVELVRRLAGLLEPWARSTRAPRPWSDAELESELLEPARRVAPRLAGGAEYVAWLALRCGEMRAASVPRVATHGDMTMSNVLVADGDPGVVDWEHARADGLPSVDLLYAITDAAAAVDGYRDRVAAWRRCFIPGGDREPWVSGLRRQVERAVGIDPGIAALCEHACWLHHAGNELAGGEAGPFVGIVQELANRRTQWQPASG